MTTERAGKEDTEGHHCHAGIFVCSLVLGSNPHSDSSSHIFHKAPGIAALFTQINLFVELTCPVHLSSTESILLHSPAGSEQEKISTGEIGVELFGKHHVRMFGELKSHKAWELRASDLGR